MNNALYEVPLNLSCLAKEQGNVQLEQYARIFVALRFHPGEDNILPHVDIHNRCLYSMPNIEQPWWLCQISDIFDDHLFTCRHVNICYLFSMTLNQCPKILWWWLRNIVFNKYVLLCPCKMICRSGILHCLNYSSLHCCLFVVNCAGLMYSSFTTRHTVCNRFYLAEKGGTKVSLSLKWKLSLSIESVYDYQAHNFFIHFWPGVLRG